MATTVLATTLALAGGLHLGVALEHEITSRYGAFFVTLGALQVALTVLVVRRPSPRLLAGCVAISIVAVSAWAASRLPAFGQREAIGVLDLAVTGLEVLTIGVGLFLLRGPVRPRPAPALRMPVILASAAVAAMSTTTVPASHADHHHGIREASAPDDGHGHAVTAGAHGGPTSDKPIFGDLFADHHAAAETAGDRHSGGDEHQAPSEALAEDAHADSEPLEHQPSDHHGTDGG